MSKRDELIRAMNPKNGKTWSAEAQALNLALFDQAAAMPDGWTMTYDVCDDDTEHSPNNRAIFAAEHKAHVRNSLAARVDRFGDDDDKADMAAMPDGGDHVLIVLKHESGAVVRRWANRGELRDAKAPSGRVTLAARKDAIQSHIDAALTLGAARVKQRGGKS
jgi:hypothetical protein